MKKLVLILFLFCPLMSFSQKLKKMDTVYVNSEGTVVMLPGWIKNVTVFAGSLDFIAVVKGGSTIFLQCAVSDAKPARLWFRYGDAQDDYKLWMVYKNFIPEDQLFVKIPEEKEMTEIKPDSTVVDTVTIQTQLINQRAGVFLKMDREKFNSIADHVENVWVKLSDLAQDNKFYYIKLGVMNNNSRKTYEIGVVDFFYKNGNDVREHHQEMDQYHPKNVKVLAEGGEDVLFVVPKFNMGSKWYLSVGLNEKNGAAKHEIKIKYSLLEDADKLN